LHDVEQSDWHENNRQGNILETLETGDSGGRESLATQVAERELARAENAYDQVNEDLEHLREYERESLRSTQSFGVSYTRARNAQQVDCTRQ
jgi:hypothetical protein